MFWCGVFRISGKEILENGLANGKEFLDSSCLWEWQVANGWQVAIDRISGLEILDYSKREIFVSHRVRN